MRPFVRIAVVSSSLTMFGLSATACKEDSEEAAGVDGEPGATGAAAAAVADYGALSRAADPDDREAFVLAPKMTVGEIVDQRYGNRHYTRVVLLHNDIRDASRLPVGKRIETPDFEQVLAEAPGLRRRAGEEMERLAKARRVYMALEGELAAQTSDDPDPMKVEVPAELGAKLEALAAELSELGELMAQERPETRKPPTNMVGNLLQAAATLERVAKGEVLDEKFDVDLIHQRLGNAMADALIWARVEFR